MSSAPPEFAAEPTETDMQTLIPEVVPITCLDRLALRAAAPMRPKKLQRPCDFGLFDLAARDQLDLFTMREAGLPRAQDPSSAHRLPRPHI